jgi:hypothetical protein
MPAEFHHKLYSSGESCYLAVPMPPNESLIPRSLNLVGLRCRAASSLRTKRRSSAALPGIKFIPPMRKERERRLPTNRTPSSHPSPPLGEKVPGGRLRGICNGSWHQFASKSWRLALHINRSNRRQVLDCGDEVCAVAALNLKPSRSGWTDALESSCAQAVNRSALPRTPRRWRAK